MKKPDTPSATKPLRHELRVLVEIIARQAVAEYLNEQSCEAKLATEKGGSPTAPASHNLTGEASGEAKDEKDKKMNPNVKMRGADFGMIQEHVAGARKPKLKSANARQGNLYRR